MNHPRQQYAETVFPSFLGFGDGLIKVLKGLALCGICRYNRGVKFSCDSSAGYRLGLSVSGQIDVFFCTYIVGSGQGEIHQLKHRDGGGPPSMLAGPQKNIVLGGGSIVRVIGISIDCSLS